MHLDVKPRNIIMAGRPRLIDLSVARRRASAPAAWTRPVGTDAYMAPEQCEVARFGELGPATDVWGLGATLYEALAGEPPFPPDGERFPQLRHAPAPLAAPGAGAGWPRWCAPASRRTRRPAVAAAQLERGLQALVGAAARRRGSAASGPAAPRGLRRLERA